VNRDGSASPEALDPRLQGVTVRLYDSSNTLIATTTTNADGRYTFTGAFDGTYRVEVDSGTGPLGTGTWTESFDSDGVASTDEVTVTLVAGGSAVADFSYFRSGTVLISGTLYYDWNGDGVQDSNEEGVAGVQVRLFLDLNGNGVFDPGVDALVASTVTDADGFYSFEGLADGDYVVVVSLGDPNMPPLFTITGDPDAVFDGRTAVELDGVDVTDRDFGFQPFGFADIEGYVWRDRNADGERLGAAETGIAGVTVTLYADMNGDGIYVPIAVTETDAAGNYRFSDYPDGNYRVIVDSTDPDLPKDAVGNTWSSTTAEQVDVTITGGVTSNDANFGFGPLGAIGDTIFLDVNRNGTQDLGEPGIAGVIVELFQDDVLIDWQVTDGSGNYLFSGLPAGTYTVRVREDSAALAGHILSADPDSDGEPCDSPLAFGCDGETSVTLSVGQFFTGADFGYYPPGASLSGIVWIDFNDDGIVGDSEPRLSSSG
jgi:hypothetical protein